VAQIHPNSELDRHLLLVEYPSRSLAVQKCGGYRVLPNTNRQSMAMMSNVAWAR
jgi:hypothetical protein